SHAPARDQATIGAVLSPSAVAGGGAVAARIRQELAARPLAGERDDVEALGLERSEARTTFLQRAARRTERADVGPEARVRARDAMIEGADRFQRLIAARAVA